MVHLLSFLFGVIFGSFLNVIIYRIPNGLSIVSPRSFCIHCNNKISFFRNIPIISYILLRGKCNNCKEKISFSYPIVEFITGIIFIIGLNKFQIPESLVFILVTSLLLSISIIDYKHFIIPYQISISILLILMPYVIFYSNTSYHIYGMIIGLSYLLLIFILTWLITKKQAIGYGDIQLIILLGLWLGPLKILITIFLSACIGILYWGLLSIINGYTKHKKLPFGTFLSISSIIVYLIKLNWDLFR